MVKRWAIVTGAASGIGLGVSKALIETADLCVLAVDKDNDGLTTLVSEFPGKVKSIHADLSDLSCVETISKAIPKEDEIKYVVHNAVHGDVVLFKDLTPEEMDYTFKVNFITPFFITQKLFPRLDKDKSRLLLIGAYAAIQPQGGLPAYGLSRAANLHMYKTFKVEFSDSNVLTGYVSPGGVNTKGFHHFADRAKELNLPLSKMLEKQKENVLKTPELVGRFYKFLLCDTEDQEFQAQPWRMDNEDHWARWKTDN